MPSLQTEHFKPTCVTPTRLSPVRVEDHWGQHQEYVIRNAPRVSVYGAANDARVWGKSHWIP